MQYLIDKDFTVFNPYLLFVNPVSLNNHDVNNVINFVKGVTFFKYDKRKTISVNIQTSPNPVSYFQQAMLPDKQSQPYRTTKGKSLKQSMVTKQI